MGLCIMQVQIYKLASKVELLVLIFYLFLFVDVSYQLILQISVKRKWFYLKLLDQQTRIDTINPSTVSLGGRPAEHYYCTAVSRPTLYRPLHDSTFWMQWASCKWEEATIKKIAPTAEQGGVISSWTYSVFISYGLRW